MRDLDLATPLLREGDAVVSASAGSGKTFTLTALVCSELGLGDLRPYEILATTFSEAAASDLRNRLLRPLDLLASLDVDAWPSLLGALGDDTAFPEALSRTPLPPRLAKSREEVRQAARIWSPALAWASSPVRAMAFWRRTRREAELLQVSTLHALALSLLRQGDGAPRDILDAAHPALLRLLRQSLRGSLGRPEEDPDQAPSRILLRWAETHWEDLSKAHDGHRDALGTLDPPDLPGLRSALDGALCAAETFMGPFASEPDRAMGRTKKGERKKGAHPSKLKPLPPPGAPLDRRLRWAETQAATLLNKEGAVLAYFAEDLEPAAEAFATVADALEALLGGLLTEALRTFEAQKVARGCATFGDLVRQALDGLRTGLLPAPRPRLLLVDEYQDTSRVQDAFLAALRAERSVRVGDLKQAIYGFRGGDPGLLREHLRTAGERAYRLPANHRSAAPVVALANRYVDEIWPRLASDARDLDGHQEAPVAGPWPVGYAQSDTTGRGAELPELADWIAPLAQEAGWSAALGAPGIPGPRRRALLLRQRTGLGRLLMRLKAQGVQPYVLAKEGFWESPGVRLLLTALEAVARPEQPIPAGALLRQLAGWTDAELTALAAASGGRLPGLGALPDALPEHRRASARFLKGLLGLPPLELAGRLLAEGTLLAVVGSLEAQGTLEPLRARRNLAGALVLLQDLPAHPATAFTLVEQLRTGLERGDVPGDAAEADLLIHTTHASKGLEYDDVILPLLQATTRGAVRGDLLPHPETREPLFGWKLASLKGRSLQVIDDLKRSRARQDDLNLLYVALTRARERMVLVRRGRPEPVPPEKATHWADVGALLAEGHPELRHLAGLPPAGAQQRRLPGCPSLPPERPPLPPTLPPESIPGLDPESAARATLKGRREGEAMHAYVRDLLVRWEDAEALAACPEPDVPGARRKALRFLEQMESRGWRHLRRRTELPLEGAAASGALGFADLVVFAPDAIHLVDLKHSEAFSPADLATYGAQLRRYAAVLTLRHHLPVDAWLVALKSGEWVEVEV